MWFYLTAGRCVEGVGKWVVIVSLTSFNLDPSQETACLACLRLNQPETCDSTHSPPPATTGARLLMPNSSQANISPDVVYIHPSNIHVYNIRKIHTHSSVYVYTHTRLTFNNDIKGTNNGT